MTDAGNASQFAELDARYVAARRVLLDALTVLAPHGDAVILAGAQAIYLHTGAADLAIAPYTTDGDLVLNPLLLGDAPELEAGMSAAGFHLQQSPVAMSSQASGWLVPPLPERFRSISSSPRAQRRASADVLPDLAPTALALHGGLSDSRQRWSTTARWPLQRSSPATSAHCRRGWQDPAALFVAKAHKLHDRVASGRAARLDDKDASDVVRLMQSTRPDEVSATLSALAQDALVGPSTTEALNYIEELFGRRGRPGIEMASRALRIAIPENRVEGDLRRVRHRAYVIGAPGESNLRRSRCSART
jgi:hypothetical protein